MRKRLLITEKMLILIEVEFIVVSNFRNMPLRIHQSYKSVKTEIFPNEYNFCW